MGSGCVLWLFTACRPANTKFSHESLQFSLDILNGVSQLEVDWISKSCAEQRKGRAGRCQEGVCYRLYSKRRYISFEPQTAPEILRTQLAVRVYVLFCFNRTYTVRKQS